MCRPGLSAAALDCQEDEKAFQLRLVEVQLRLRLFKKNAREHSFCGRCFQRLPNKQRLNKIYRFVHYKLSFFPLEEVSHHRCQVYAGYLEHTDTQDSWRQIGNPVCLDGVFFL